MFADADHEVIDSPEALFRHLHEEHGVAEALELDPETAPVQFWVRRHAELERAQRSARRQPDPPPRPEPRPQPEARSQRSEPTGARDGRRQVGFADPLLEAMTRALVGRGHDEAAVRAAVRSFPATGGRPAGEAGVRSAFVEPMLRAVAEHLLTPGGPARPAADPAPAREEPARPEAARETAAREEPARPEAAWAVLWADLADPRRRAGEGAGAAGDEGDDLMAVANAVQARRRVRLLRR
jgi:hypothetical protein